MEECVAHHNRPSERSMELTGVLPVATGIVDRSAHEPSAIIYYEFDMNRHICIGISLCALSALDEYVMDNK